MNILLNTLNFDVTTKYEHENPIRNFQILNTCLHPKSISKQIKLEVRFGCRGRDLGVEAGIWALRLVFGLKAGIWA